MTLAILEHWFLVLPLPAAALWRWSLRLRDRPPEHEREQARSIVPAPHQTTKPRTLAWQQR